MTPKEKSRELFDKFYEEIGDHWSRHLLSKKCALIAVDEILKCPQTFDTEQVKYSDGTYAREYYEIPNRYWTKVKDEIEKL